MMGNIDNIVLDWNGTVIDDRDIVFGIAQEILRIHGVNPVPSTEECRRIFTLPYMNIYRIYIRNPDKKEIDRIYSELYKTASPEPFPDAEPTLQFLRAQGIKLVVLSSHAKHYLESEAQRFFKETYFDAIYGGVNDKAEVLESLVGNGFDKKRTLFVGDMVEDVFSGKKAGVLTAAVLSNGRGYHFEDMLRAAEPDFVIQSLSSLKQLVSYQNTSLPSS